MKMLLLCRFLNRCSSNQQSLIQSISPRISRFFSRFMSDFSTDSHQIILSFLSLCFWCLYLCSAFSLFIIVKDFKEIIFFIRFFVVVAFFCAQLFCFQQNVQFSCRCYYDYNCVTMTS